MIKNQIYKGCGIKNENDATVLNETESQKTENSPVEVKGSLPKVLIPFLPLQQLVMEGRSIWKMEQ